MFFGIWKGRAPPSPPPLGSAPGTSEIIFN